MGEKYLKPSDLVTIEQWIKKVEEMHHKLKKYSRNHALRKLKISYKVIGTGRSRIVFDLKTGYVLKIAFSNKGIKDNKSEAMLYESSLPTIKNHLAKVVDHGHGWCIMEKIMGSSSENKKNKDLVYKLQDEFVSAGITPNDLTNRRNNEPRWKNFRIDNRDRIVVIDYANFIKASTVRTIG
ncbi:hypothetical protein [Paenibacillus eucommiae]|uniref:Uncharacterized protein n=1 Tax=Paenibacillus eucommiae TaxID=1355755 RepID=A0ABS4IV03_9BACL|nr:hypothetical protein [Paenibacillus eucommiae]MBP1991410.1 hypothetical protein [Paenibacillus eucommiae]